MVRWRDEMVDEMMRDDMVDCETDQIKNIRNLIFISYLVKGRGER